MALLWFLLALLVFIQIFARLSVALSIITGASLTLLCGYVLGLLDLNQLQIMNAFYARLNEGLAQNRIIMAIPLFLLMGSALEYSGLMHRVLGVLTRLFGTVRGGGLLSALLLGAILAAMSGVVGASITLLGLLVLPNLLKQGYPAHLSTGTIAAVGTLGQLMPPSIILLILADSIAGLYLSAQYKIGNYAPQAISVADFFEAAIIPALLLLFAYMLYVFWAAPKVESAPKYQEGSIIDVLLALALIALVLLPLLWRLMTPSESAALGAAMALILTGKDWQNAIKKALVLSAKIAFLMIAASYLSLTLKVLGADAAIKNLLETLSSGNSAKLLLIALLIMFFAGFIFDIIELLLIFVPLLGASLFSSTLDPVKVGILLALCAQTAFLTPPLGLSLLYLRGVAPKSVRTGTMIRGIGPFVIIQITFITLYYFYTIYSV